MNPNIGFWVGSIHSSGSQFTTLPYTTNVDDHSQVSATAAALLRGCSVGVSLQPYDRPQPIIFMTYRRPKPRKTLINNCCTFDTLSQPDFGACYLARQQNSTKCLNDYVFQVHITIQNGVK